MRPAASSTIVVAGATGRQGGAVARALLEAGWGVRALTRSPDSQAARELAATGAEVVHAAEHQHVVYGSAGTGASDTGIGWWDSKLEIEAHMRALGLPLTIVRPVAFMELMTDRDFYPPVSTWHLMPKLAGGSTPIPWIAVDDAAAVAALAFAEPARYVGRDLKIATELRSVDECRELYAEVMGRRPRRVPMPVWLFNRVASRDLTTMWRWLGASPPAGNSDTLRAIRPAALTVREWLRRKSASRAQPR